MLTSTCSLSCSQSYYHWLLITLASLQPFQSFFALKSPISLSISSLCVVPYSIFLRKLKSMISLFFHFNISSSPCPALVSTDTILLLFTCIFCHTSILVESVCFLTPLPYPPLYTLGLGLFSIHSIPGLTSPEMASSIHFHSQITVMSHIMMFWPTKDSGPLRL